MEMKHWPKKSSLNIFHQSKNLQTISQKISIVDLCQGSNTPVDTVV